MAYSSEDQNKACGVKTSKAARDLVLLILAVMVVLVLSYYFDVFMAFVRFMENHPENMTYIDEMVMGLLSLSIGLAIFAWRRWLELKRESAQRLKEQEELIKLSTTQADVERIISKQLRSDMDQMKEDVREILGLIHGRQNR